MCLNLERSGEWFENFFFVQFTSSFWRMKKQQNHSKRNSDRLNWKHRNRWETVELGSWLWACRTWRASITSLANISMTKHISARSGRWWETKNRQIKIRSTTRCFISTLLALLLHFYVPFYVNFIPLVIFCFYCRLMRQHKLQGKEREREWSINKCLSRWIAV